ncbi:MAG: acyl-CoA thioesterase [Dokdonella sp.]
MAGKQREISLRFLAEPTDVNFGGKVHGGTVMRWIDQAGYAAAVGWSGQYCVTVAVGGIHFLQPVLIGDLVSVTATLIRTGTSSLHFAVDVMSRNLQTNEEKLTTHCVIVFVAVDPENGKPVAVPEWTPLTKSDRELAAYALRIKELSTHVDVEAARHRPAREVVAAKKPAV